MEWLSLFFEIRNVRMPCIQSMHSVASFCLCFSFTFVIYISTRIACTPRLLLKAHAHIQYCVFVYRHSIRIISSRLWKNSLKFVCHFEIKDHRKTSILVSSLVFNILSIKPVRYTVILYGTSWLKNLITDYWMSWH